MQANSHDNQINPNNMASITKTIYLIRHGVAAHNVHDPNTGERPDYHNPDLTDPPLLHHGEWQASILGENLKRIGLIDASRSMENVAVGNEENSMDFDDNRRQRNSPIELIVTSPLTRCLQTASHIFPSYFQVYSPDENSITLDESSQHYVLNRDCKICCHGDIREAYGMHYPDRRSPLSTVKSKFPTVAYHPAITEHDTDWKPHTRETRHDVAERARKFFHWLLHQPHDNIAVVSHGVWIECALREYCPEVLEFGRKRVYNCEVYCGNLVGRKSVKGNDCDSMNDLEIGLSDVTQIGFYQA
mmetsp:Transcript_7107/g.15326  ORF Transcript_7107/g.15326 Transcript_7107/m.15326 type:complete len:302 (+) Transcript_7107:107-1012(+)|eukprot:CAMPEP_0171423270 /NCGR_PEP_ID=MMETSP0881-20121228/1865_1 /TAXON_ID=67004 /ORGANISM="Thalassiosira weissflogii, Strain CCMP1336" /LENGTH=301 /DNA_ID=CAMNT_0011942129 /DNA_START=32 /DNA_END=937 /DNA_ORIENTATION=-